MAEAGRLSIFGRFLALVTFSGVLLSTTNTVDAKKVRTGVVTMWLQFFLPDEINRCEPLIIQIIKWARFVLFRPCVTASIIVW